MKLKTPSKQYNFYHYLAMSEKQFNTLLTSSSMN